MLLRRMLSAVLSIVMAIATLVGVAQAPASAVTTAEDTPPIRVLTSDGSLLNQTSMWGGFLKPDRAGNTYMSLDKVVRVFAPGASGTAAPIRSLTNGFSTQFLSVDPSDFLHVSENLLNRIAVFAPGAGGSQAPVRLLSKIPYRPHSLAFAKDGTMYVVGTSPTSINVYAPGAVGAPPTPIRTITGPETTLTTIHDIAVDSAGYIYVTDLTGNRIVVFAPNANGDVAPVRVISGPKTKLQYVGYLAFDHQENLVWAGPISGAYLPRDARVLVFPKGANGDVEPMRFIMGPNTGMGRPNGVHVERDGAISVYGIFPQKFGTVSGYTATVTTYAPLVASVPEPPQNLDVVPGNGQATVSFTPGGDGKSPITSYEYRVNGGAWVSAGLPGNNKVVVTPLTNRVEATVELRAINAVGASMPSQPVKVIPGTPGAPTNLVPTPKLRSATIAFTPPVVTGTSRITNYEYQLNGVGPWMPFEPAITGSPGTIPMLTNGPTYAIALRAVNSVGPGEPSDPVTVTVQDAPSAPEAVTGVGGDSRATINWTMQGTTSPAVQNYEVEYSTSPNGPFLAPAGGTCKPSVAAPAMTCSVTGLTNGTKYYFRVTAQNALGTSKVSEVSDAVLVAGAPSAPRVQNATPGDGRIVVDYLPSLTDGGLPIKGYEYSTDNGTTWKTAGPSPITISGLTNGQQYRVHMRAMNAVATSDKSFKDATPIATSTLAYTGVATVKPGEQTQLSALLTVGTSPARPVAGRTVKFTVGGKDYTATTDAKGFAQVLADVVSDAVGTKLPVSVSFAGTASETAANDSAKVEVEPAGAPNAVAEAATSVTNSDATLNGTVNARGESTAVSFEIATDADFTNAQLLPASPATATGISDAAVTASASGLRPGVTYYFRVRAGNASGETLSEVETFTAAPVKPDVADAPESAPKPTSVTLNSDVNPNGAATAVTFSYAKSQSDVSNGDGTDVDAGTVSGTESQPMFAELADLEPNTTYYYRVTATNSAGTTTSDIRSFTTPIGKPGAPVLYVPAPGDEEVELEFAPPSDLGGGTIIGYQYSIDDGETWQDLGTTTSPAKIGDLVNGREYSVQLRVVNESGAGDASDPILVTPVGNVSVTWTGSATVREGRSARLSAIVRNSKSGNPIPGIEVTFELAGKTYKATSDEDGYAAVRSDEVNEEPDTTLPVTVTTAETGTYSASSDSAELTVEPALAPNVRTGDAAPVTVNGAMLHGKVDAEGDDTTVAFEISEDPDDFTGDRQVLASPLVVTGKKGTDVEAAVTGLVSGNKYYYRLKAANINGVSYGDVLSFTTGTLPVTVSLVAPPTFEPGEPFTVTVRVGGEGEPTGTVQIRNGSDVLCEAPVVNGQASCEITVEDAEPLELVPVFKGTNGYAATELDPQPKEVAPAGGSVKRLNLRVNALSDSTTLPQSGTTVLVKSAQVPRSQGKSSIRTTVRCWTKSRGNVHNRGDLRYCRYQISDAGRVSVTTLGSPNVRVRVTQQAVPSRSNKSYRASKTWQRVWRTR